MKQEDFENYRSNYKNHINNISNFEYHINSIVNFIRSTFNVGIYSWDQKVNFNYKDKIFFKHEESKVFDGTIFEGGILPFSIIFSDNYKKEIIEEFNNKRLKEKEERKQKRKEGKKSNLIFQINNKISNLTEDQLIEVLRKI